jgi:RHS repeat-associated protein
VLYKENMLSSSMSELYHANGSGNGYDSLNQLTAFARGTLNGGKDTISSPARTQAWDYDATGNWESSTTNSITTTRTHNKQNEITAVGSATPAYAANGNMTTDETGQTLKYDAWNRLVEVKNSGGTTLSAYVPDALTRRVKETSGGTTRDLYYSAAWQVLEEKVSGDTDTRQVWSPVYVDELVLRERDTNTGLSGLEERVYVVQDANHNVTALVSISGTVLQRFVYDPYGQATVLDASWGSTTDGYAWRYLHQGGRFDAAVGLYSFRFRDYDPVLGRWTVMDPIGFTAGDVNWYRYESNTPVVGSDWSGLKFYATVGDKVLEGAAAKDWFFKELATSESLAIIFEELFKNQDFQKIWDYLENSEFEIELRVTPGLKNREKEIFGGFTGTATGRLELNPSKIEVRQNPLELIDTLIHELIHAVLHVRYTFEKDGVDWKTNYPLSNDVLDIRTDRTLGSNGINPLTGMDKGRINLNPELKNHCDKNYGDYSKPGDPLRTTYVDINRFAQELIRDIISILLADDSIAILPGVEQTITQSNLESLKR